MEKSADSRSFRTSEDSPAECNLKTVDAPMSTEDDEDKDVINVEIFIADEDDSNSHGVKDAESNEQISGDKGGKSQFPCPNIHCTKVFLSANHLEKHLNSKCKAPRLERKPPFQCKYCQVVVSSFRALEEHTRRHTNEKPYRCSVCNQSFRQFACYSKHMAVHTDDKPFQCELCFKNFKHREYLKSHMLTHTNEKNFPCSVCDKRYRSRSDLNRHEIIHSGKKPFRCPVCDMSFSDGSTCRRHIRNHGKEKSIQCHICQYTCATLPLLRTHLVKAHKDYVSNVKILPNGVLQYVYKENNQLYIKLQSAKPVTGKRMCEMTVTEVDSPTDTAIPTIPTTVSVSNPETETLEDSLIQPADVSGLNNHDTALPVFPGRNVVHVTTTTDPQSISGSIVEVQSNKISHSYTHDSTTDKSMPEYTVEEEDNQTTTSTIHLETYSEDVNRARDGIVLTDNDETRPMVIAETEESHGTSNDTDMETVTSPDTKSKNDNPGTQSSHAEEKSDVVVIASQHPSQESIAQKIQESFDSDFLLNPDFSSQEFYDWLSDFTNLCQLLAMPLSAAVFGKINDLEKLIASKLATPTDFIKQKENFKSLMTIAKYLKNVLNSHLNHVMSGLDDE